MEEPKETIDLEKGSLEMEEVEKANLEKNMTNDQTKS